MRLFQLTMALALTSTSLPVLAQMPTAPATPQGQAEMMQMVQLAGRNQLGVLKYCQDQGSVGADTVALQQRILTMMPPAQVAGLDEAEAAGRRGIVQFGGSQVPLADAAKAQNTTPDAMCKQIASMLQAQAAQLPK